MQRIIVSAIIIFGLMITGCRSARMSKQPLKDSTVSQSPAAVLKPVDSTEILKQQLAASINTPLDFTTFYGKAKASFNSPQASGNVTVYIKILKDSIIWISVTGPLNIEGARILVTPDSVKIMNKIEGSVQISSIKSLQKITKLPLKFDDFQNIILGKPIVDENTSLDYQIKKDSVTAAAANNLFQYMYSFTKNNFLLGQSNFKTVNNSSAITANIFYNDYKDVNGINFSAGRDIAVTGAAEASLELNFKEYNFNQPQSFVFTISKNYTIKYE